MKFALINGVRAEATPKAAAVCQGCGAPMIAKCGQNVIWHWAHKPGMLCDHWWESETEWHRSWKNRFPLPWQEVVLENPITRERHIADIRTTGGLVLEIQRSSINPIEVQARESFYQKMIWIVDGTKNYADPFNFSNMRSQLDEDGVVSFRWYGRSKLFNRWHSTKPVFIDFGSDHGFWRILRFDPATKSGLALLVNIEGFVALASSGSTDYSSCGGPASLP